MIRGLEAKIKDSIYSPCTSLWLASSHYKSSQVYFIVTFKMRKRKQQKTIQSPCQPYLIASL